MAKDPAFLFYPGDFLTGVQDLTMEERGQYITLLCLQHQKGHLTEKMIRLSCGNAAADVMAKFKQDAEGNFYNQRLELEMEKRAAHGEKQRLRAVEGWKKRKDNDNQPSKEQSGNAAAYTTADAMALPLEDRNENRDRIKDSNEIETEKPKREIFKRPEMPEVLEWMRKANMAAGNIWKDDKIVAEAKKFWNYYESNGWKVGRNPMKKWDAAARNWMNNANKFDNGNGKQGFSGTKLASPTGNRIHDEHQRRAAEVVDHLRRKFASEEPVDSGNEDPPTDSSDYTPCEVID